MLTLLRNSILFIMGPFNQFASRLLYIRKYWLSWYAAWQKATLGLSPLFHQSNFYPWLVVVTHSSTFKIPLQLSASLPTLVSPCFVDIWTGLHKTVPSCSTLPPPSAQLPWVAKDPSTESQWERLEGLLVVFRAHGTKKSISAPCCRNVLPSFKALWERNMSARFK